MAPSRSARFDRDRLLARVGATQATCFSRAQALDVGFTDPTIRRRVGTGTWDRIHPGVYRFAGTPATWQSEIWAALLAVGPMSAVTHETAVRLSGSPHVSPRPVTLTVPHGAHPRVRGATVHQIDDLRPHHLIVVDGLPVSEPARAVVELAAVLGRRRLGLVLDDLVFDRRTSYAKVSARLLEVARPGKPGVDLLAGLLDDRSDEGVPHGSELERALTAALVGGGLPVPARQVALPGRGAVEGVVDAAYADCRLVLEADGRRWHTRVRDLARDHARDAEAARAGWQTLRFLFEAIVHDPEGVVATVTDVRAVRLGSPVRPGPEAMAVTAPVPRRSWSHATARASRVRP